MRKTSTMKKLYKRLTFNRFISIAALIVSTITLIITVYSNIIAKQSNEIAEEANQILIKSISAEMNLLEQGETLTITGCHTKDDKYYYVNFFLNDEFTFTNLGGKKASLYEVKLQHVDSQYYVNIYNSNQSTPEKVFPPLDIEPGSTEKWGFMGEMKLVLQSATELSSLLDTQRENRFIKTEWEFKFSDGSSFKQEGSIVNLSINPNINSLVCENN